MDLPIRSKPLPFLQKFEAGRQTKNKYRNGRIENTSVIVINLNLKLSVLICGLFLIAGVGGEYIPPGPKYRCPAPNQIWPCRCTAATDDGITLNCIDVSLATLSAALAYPVAYKTPVTYLNITKLNTEKLYGTVFDDTNATKITIRDSPIKEIYSDVFFNTRDTLKELELLNTNLQELPVSSFHDLGNLESLIIDKHLITKLDKPMDGLTALKNLRVSNGNISEFSKGVFGPLGGKLARLDLHGNQLKSVPKDGFQSLKVLEYLDVSFNTFEKLDPTFFFHLSKLTWLNASHNGISEFKRGAFARNSYLRVVYLTHNKIAKIDAAAFRGMRLVRLYLSDNRIADIGRAAFNSLQQIKTIDLSRNFLKLVDFQMFLKLPWAEEINLQENNITTIKSGAFNELAYIKVNLSHNQISTIEKDAFVNCINITVLDLSYNLIDNFTKNSFDELSYAEEFKLDHNRLQRTADIPIKFMSGLKILNVSNNDLKEVSKNTFPKLYELHTVDLSWNNISKIHSGVFGNAFNLRVLDLRYNNLTDLSGSAFGPIPTMLELHLDHNRLKAVSSAAFSKLVSLRELTISNNKLKKVFQISGSLNDLDLSYNEIDTLSRAWPVMNALQRLNLSYNQLGGNLGPGSFENLGPLSQIRLAGNNITEIPVQALSDLRTVQYIDLSSNFLTTLPKASLGRLPIVFTLILSHNNISTIEFKAFDGLLQLLHLDLSHNVLVTIPGGGLSSLVSLRKLDLSHNLLYRTDNGTNCIFEDNLSLESVDLSHNDISIVYPNSFPEQRWTNYKLEEVNLSNNKLTQVTKELLKGTRTVKRMNLSHNKISALRPNIVANMGSMEILDLSYNLLNNIEDSGLGPQPPPNLTVLNLKSNNLKGFPMGLLAKAPFKLINLEGNRFKLLDLEFFPKIRNGSRILLNDNPLSCDCRLIFIQRYFIEQRPELTNFTQEFFKDYESFQCKLGPEREERFLKDLKEGELICDYSDDPLGPVLTIPENHDVELRSFTQTGTSAQIRWRVKSKMDILGFQILVLGGGGGGGENGRILSSETFGYNVRAAGVKLPRGASEVCLVPNFSFKSLTDHLTITEEILKTLKKSCRNLDAGVVSASYANASASKSKTGCGFWGLFLMTVALLL